MAGLRMPTREAVYTRVDDFVVFNQLAVKIEMDAVGNDDYYAWLDRTTASIGRMVPGAQIAEKENARTSPPLNTAIYYDTADYRILPTGALLRTSCNRITHAFCAFKMPEDGHGVRRDHRYMFSGSEKQQIQLAPASPESVAIVHRLLARTDIEHPGVHLKAHYGHSGDELSPAIILEDYRFTFFAWLDDRDALRCSIDRYRVSDLRVPEEARAWKPVSEVELAVYPRIALETARDRRVVDLIQTLAEGLCSEFGTRPTRQIKYQRGAQALGIRPNPAE